MAIKSILKKSCAVFLAVLTIISMLTVVVVEQPLEVLAASYTSTNNLSGASNVAATFSGITKNGQNASSVTNGTATANRLEAHAGASSTYPNNQYFYGSFTFSVTAKPIYAADTSYTFSGWSNVKVNGSSSIATGGTITSTTSNSGVCKKLIAKNGLSIATSTTSIGFGTSVYAISGGSNGNANMTITVTATATFKTSSGATKTATYTWKPVYYARNLDGAGGGVYTVSYNANGGSGAPSSQTKTVGVNLTLSSTKPTKSYTITYNANSGSVSPASKSVSCTFNNWKAIDGTTYQPGGSYTANAATTLTAQWTNPTAGTLATPTRTGYTFNGWYTAASGGTKVTSSTPISADTTIYAQWSPDTYPVTYDANGGSNAPADQTKTYGTALTLSGTKPTRTGYTFSKWNTKADGSGTNYSPSASYTTNAALALYAQWTPINYIVKFDGNGSTSGTMADQSFEYDIAQNLTANAFKKTGHTFLGWSTSKTATTATYTDKQSVKNLTTTNGGTVTLYAVWKPDTYTVTYMYKGNVVGTQTKTYGVDLTLDGPTPGSAFNISGPIEDGWYTTDSVEGTLYNDGDIYTTNANLTLYKVPQAMAIYFTNFPDGTQTTFYQQTCSADIEVPVYATAPIFEGYKFVGWSKLNTSNTANDQTVIATHQIGDTIVLPQFTSTPTIFFAVWEPITYTVSYYAPGATSPFSTQTKEYNIDLTLNCPTLDMENAVFLGWNTEKDGSGTYYSTDDVYTTNADMDLYGIVRFEVTYDANGGSGAPASQTKESAIDLTLHTTEPTRTGYDFDGWNTKADGSGTAYASGATYNKDESVTLYAQWDPYTYPVTYYANSGENAPAAQTKVYDVDLTLSSDKPAKEGYTFLGWNTKADGSGDDYTPGATYSVNAKLDLYAQWEINDYDIVYYVDGVKHKTETYNYGAKVTALAEPSKTGYTFSGWSEIPETMPANNVEVKGTFAINSYTITYISDGETYKTAEYNYNANIADVEEPVKNGYTFTGWSPEVPKTMPANDVTVTAQWSANNYIVKFNGNGATSGSMDDQTFEYDVAQNLSANAFDRTGHTWLGWSTDKSATTAEFTDKQSVKNLTAVDGGTVTLYAVWDANPYKLIYNANGGVASSAPATQTGDYGTTLTVSSTVPTREGYTFLGWSEDNKATVADEAYNGGNKYVVPAHDTTVYAVWKINVYNIDYVLNGGKNSDENPTTYTIEDEFDFKNPTRSGYAFNGWYTDETFNISINGIEKGTTGDITVYADWTPIDYDITYNLNGGTNAPENPTAYTIESEITYVNATRTGYTFKGWYSDEDLTISTDGISIGTTGTVNVYAKWTAIIYPINYVLYGGTNSDKNPLTYTIETPDIAFEPATRADYDFMGWLNGDGEKVTILPTGSYGPVTLYADWKLHDYTITYECNGGTNHPNNVPFYNYEDEITLYPADREGYDFIGWHEKEDFSDEVITEFGPNVSGDKVLYAEWTPVVYNITYETNGGINSEVNSATYTVEDEVSFSDATREHYEFDGWYLDNETFTQSITGIELGTIGDITVYAKWQPVYHKVNYILNDGVNNELNPDKLTYFEVAMLSEPTRKGYSFAGWYNENDELITEIKELESAVTVTAKWTPVVYNITYVYNGGYTQPKNPTTYTIEDDVQLYGCYKPGDYVFYYWMTEDGEKVMHLADGRTGDLTLYAYFKYVEGSGNIKATGEFDNSVATGSLTVFGSLVIVAALFIVIVAKKRKKNAENGSN